MLIAPVHATDYVHSQKYFFQNVADPYTFLRWAEDEIRTVTWGVNQNSRVVEKSRDIPAAYYRVVCQLVAEIAHASVDFSHESLRRCSYAMEVLDAFGAELASIHSTTARFRSKVLTPILQRQLRGVADNHTPVVKLAVSPRGEDVTIDDASKFYLSEDPTDPQWIPTYRRNLIYIPEVRWHLGVVLGKIKLGNADEYDKIRQEHDNLMEPLLRDDTTDDGDDYNDDNCTKLDPFNEVEVATIVEDGLEEYFAGELAKVVCINISFASDH